MTDTKFATEVLDLPSEGWFYPTDNPLSSGQIEIRYMGAKEEDILTSTNLVKKGVAIDMVLKSIIVSKINYDDLLIGDKNALMVATRILGYGKDYAIQMTCPMCEKKTDLTIDLAALNHKIVDVREFPQGVNEFPFTLPISKTPITFKFLTSGDEVQIDLDVKGMKKITDNYSPELSTRLKKIITSVDGKRDVGSISKFVDQELISGDSLALRKYLAKVQPGIDMTFEFVCSNSECEHTEHSNVPVTIEFFWLAAADKLTLHRELFTIIMATEGGFDYGTVYSMPVYLRKFYMKELDAWNKKKEETIKGSKSTPPTMPKRPAIRKK